MYGGGVMPAGGQGQVLASTMPRAQNRAAKFSTLLRRRSTLPIQVYYLSMLYRVNYDEQNWGLLADFLASGHHEDIHRTNRAQVQLLRKPNLLNLFMFVQIIPLKRIFWFLLNCLQILDDALNLARAGELEYRFYETLKRDSIMRFLKICFKYCKQFRKRLQFHVEKSCLQNVSSKMQFYGRII